jgi:hypothetical protein
MAHTSCLLCRQDSSNDEGDAAGPSVASSVTLSPPKGRRRRTQMSRLLIGIASAAFALVPMVKASSVPQHDLFSRDVVTREAQIDTSLSLANLIRKRDKAKRQYGPNQNLNFAVNVTPPKTCEPMNITFNTQGGQPPYTIFVGFSNWYGYTVQLPASYADGDVSTWLYQFNVPVFRPVVASSSTTPNSVVVVSDSTGNLMNSSSFQTVVEDNTSCAGVSGSVDFTFYTGDAITACQPLQINWGYVAPQPGWKDPLSIYLLREMAPPIYLPVTNSSAGLLQYNVALKPGTNVMFTMTGKNGSGGVSGQNTVGGSEYIGTNCLTNGSSTTLPIAVPSPTSTLTNLRMPDYTATVSSLITSDGVVQTKVASETVRNGSTTNGPGASAGRIVGIATGVGVMAAVIAALASWCVWRKRHGRRNIFWDVPRSVAGDLNKERGNAPIDKNYLRNRSKTMLRTGSAGVPMLHAENGSPPSETSEDRRQIHLATSESNLSDPRYDSFSSPPNNNPYGTLTSSGSNEMTGPFINRPRRSSGSSNTSNPFNNSHAVSHSARNYRSPFRDHAAGTPEHERESMAMMDTLYGTSSRGQTSEPSAASFYDADPQYTGSRTPSNPTYVQHSDAGLLLDDSLENSEGQQIELPPQYDSVPRRAAAARRAAREANRGATSSAAVTNTTQEPNTTSDIASASPSHYDDEDGDDSKFWRSIPEDN